MIKWSLAEESLGYQTSTDPSNTDRRLLIAGSQNVLIDQQRKVKTRPGYTRLGPANPALTPNRNGWKWDTSTGTKLSQHFYSTILEVYLTTIDTVAINAWTQVSAGFSATKKLRPALAQGVSGGGWYDATEGIDLQLMVQGDDNIFEWNGAVAVIGAIPDGTHVTKAGTTTWAQNRFYTTRNKIMVCVRTGTEYTYSAGETSLTLTVGDSTGLVVGDILIQKIVTHATQPAASRNNDTIYIFQNQVILGSKSDENVYISKNSSIDDYTFSTPRLAGEGGLLTLDDPTRAICSLGTYLLVFAGRSTIFRGNYTQIAVGAVLAETLNVQKFDVGINQGALNQESVIALGNQLAYLTCEVALRTIDNIQNLTGIDPKRLSTPVKPDFDAEDWDEDNTFGIYYKNTLMFSAAASGHLWMLNSTEDANGKSIRFWNPPQILPVGPLFELDADDGLGPLLYTGSNSVPETYKLFDGISDGQYANMDVADKIAIHAIAIFAYDHQGARGVLKVFDEYYVEGEITPNTTDLILSLLYDFEGHTQSLDCTIVGTNDAILEGVVTNNSLSQAALALEPLGGLLTPPEDARRFRVIFEIAKEDFFEISARFETNEVDRYWSIIAQGSNATLSPRKPINIKM